MSINTRETIKKIEGLLFQANGNLEKTCDLLSTVKLTEDDIKILLEEMIKEYHSLFEKISWSCGITAGGAQDANASSFNEVFKLGSKELALAMTSDLRKSYNQELFKKYKKEEMSYPEGEGVQFIRELRVLSRILTISLIRKLDEVYKFTPEEIERLKEYMLVSNYDISKSLSDIDKYMHALSALIRNSSLDTKKIFELNNRMIIHTTALIDLVTSGVVKKEEAKEQSAEDLEKLICEQYKGAANTPLPLPSTLFEVDKKSA
ncbi:hypothetical protein [Wolbachia endosymbiont (group A) of Acrocera orbiculus]|uniref:hypothetical protein n=1 Tax=Wolbachia endosymbiont (group A) of Acrocera orbiculus TaxID=2953971 RepID=UPI002227DA44|nr:hypothetical protein [Wolbachia endosymbiont (group A) of Acrocera orbiculus]